MRKMIIQTLWLIVVGCYFSCVENDEGFYSSNQTSLSFSLYPTEVAGSLINNDNAITSLLILQYDDQNKLLFLDSVISPDKTISNVSINGIRSNTHSKLIFLANCSELGNILPIGSDLSELTKQYLLPIKRKFLPMYGTIEGIFNADSPTYTIIFERMVCKVELTVHNQIVAPERLTIHSITVKQSANKIYLFPSDDTLFPASLESNFMNMDSEIWNGDHWIGYLPENRRGIGSATTSLTKNAQTAPLNQADFCTYLLIRGEYQSLPSEPIKQVSFLFYLGCNAINDYNLIRNGYYALTITLKSINNWDTRIRYENGLTIQHIPNFDWKDEVQF